MQRPFLKWAGGKYQLLRTILAILPPGKRLIEPFAGSGAVFLNAAYPRYLVADNNLDLINLYQLLKAHGEEFISFCQQFFQAQFNQRERYYELRTLFNTTEDVRLKSALFIYLNRHGYNGLCRYNPHGKFNVPFGCYENPKLPIDRMLQFHAHAQKTIFKHADFTEILRQAKPGDVVYCDPPYVPLSKTANFTSYSAHSFDEDQQKILVQNAERLASKGIPVIISNHDTKFTRRAYRNAKIIQLKARRSISCNGQNRKNVKEILALFALKPTKNT